MVPKFAFFVLFSHKFFSSTIYNNLKVLLEVKITSLVPNLHHLNYFTVSTVRTPAYPGWYSIRPPL